MASTPTTKSQVQAYRFVLRRMESALVRKDSVMLHDPMGSHKRATMVGIALACVALVGFLVWGLFGGKGSVPQPGSIVIGKDSGSVYVVTADDKAEKRLIPMLNMASAKLLSMSQSQGGAQGAAPEPTTVKEAALAEFPRGPRTGMVNAPNYLPNAQNQAQPSWAICDRGTNVQDPQKQKYGEVETTVLGGEAQHGTPLSPDQSLFVQDQTTHQEYLVYVPHKGQGRDSAQVVKAPVDQSSTTIKDLYGLNGETPRTMSTHMLNAIPSAKKLEVPQQALQSNETAGYMQAVNRYEVGDVVERSLPNEQKDYFLLRPDGKQQISQGAASVLHAAKKDSGDVPNATYAVTQAPDTSPSQRIDDLDSFPEAKPKPVTWQQSEASCLSWKNENGHQNITATLNSGQMAPKAPVMLAQADGNGPQVDNFYMPAGKAAVVRSTPNEPGAPSGQLGMVSDQGVSYGIKDIQTAQGLGVIQNANDAQAGPAWLTRVLPRGAFLDPAESSYAYDSIPVDKDKAVNRPPPQQQ